MYYKSQVKNKEGCNELSNFTEKKINTLKFNTWFNSYLSLKPTYRFHYDLCFVKYRLSFILFHF